MSHPEVKGWLFRRVPALDALRTYSWTAFGRDLTAGLTVATVAVPQAMAYATLAGLPPQIGLYTAIVMTAVGAFLDSSRLLINGPTNVISIALLSALAMTPEAERIPTAVTIACLVGAIQLGIALLRFGDLTRFISQSVIVGFTLGAAVLLFLDQLKHLLGQEARGDPTDHFLKRFWFSLTSSGVHWPTFGVGVGTIAVVLAVRQVNRALRKRRFRFPIPQHLVAIILMALVVWGLRLEDEGVKVVGFVPQALPEFQLPELKWEQVRSLAGSAFAIALLGLLEAVAMAKAIAARTGQRLDINQQCLSEGAANLTGSMFQCFPGSGSLTRSAVNQQAGAVSQWSGIFAALAVAATILLFAPLVRYIPRASLAGLLLLAAYRLVDGRQLWFHMRATRFDARVVAATALAAVLISVEFCIVIGVFLSFALYIPRAAQVKLTAIMPLPEGLRERLSWSSASDELIAFELEGEMFFGTEPDLTMHLATVDREAVGKVRAVILTLRRARNPDAGFLGALRMFFEGLHARNVTLVLCDVQTDLMNALKTTGLLKLIGEQHVIRDRS